MEKNIPDVSKSFSLARFKSLAKADFSLNKDFYLKLAISIIGCYIAGAILISIYAVPEINEIKHRLDIPEDLIFRQISRLRDSMLVIYLAFGVWMISIGLSVFGSLTFNNMSTRKKRISAIMMPASTFEKFSFRMSISFIGGLIVLIVGLMSGLGILQICFHGGSGFTETVSDLFESASNTYLTISIALAIFLGWSVYALGSSIWPKLSWLKTWIVLMAFEWLIGIASISLLFSNIHFLVNFPAWLDSVDLLLWIGISLEICLIGVCSFFTWKRFRNMQIVQRFMMN